MTALTDDEVTVFGSFEFDDTQYEFLRFITMPCEDEAIMVPKGRYLLAREKVVAKANKESTQPSLLVSVGDWVQFPTPENLKYREPSGFRMAAIVGLPITGIRCSFSDGCVEEYSFERFNESVSRIYHDGEMTWERHIL